MSLRLPVLVSGDSRTLVLPATNPETGLPITIPGTATLIFSAKFSKYDPDIDAVFQKVTGAGLTVAGSTITVVIVAEDTAPLVEYADLYCDVQAQDISFGILTLWEGILPVRLGVTQGTSTSVPVYTLNPPVPGAGGGDMLASVYDPNADGKVNSAAAADAVPWTGVTGKPATFPPAGHSHPLSELTQSGATNGQVPTWTGSGFVPQTPEAGGGGGGGDMFKSTYDPDLDGKVVSAVSADSVAWVGVTGKPTTFAPSAHTHAESDVTGLVSDLAGKSDVGHTHTAAAVGADPTGTAAAAVTAHEAAGDPHPQYTTAGEVITAIVGKADASTVAAHIADTANPHATTKAQVGLGSADNTSDAGKPVSTAQATAIGLKADTTALTAHTGSTANPHAVTKSQVGLANADNTTDLGKPISTLTQAALDAKAALSHTHATTDITGFIAAASAAAPVQSVAALTGAITAAGLRTGLGLVVGTDVQAFNAGLAAISLLTTTSFGRSVLTVADAAGARTLIGAGTSSFDGVFASLTSKPTTLAGYSISDAQPLDSDLTSIAALTTTAFGRGLLTEATAATARATLGAGTSSFSGAFSALTGIPTTLAGHGITDGQPLDADLTAIAALTTDAFGLALLTKTTAALVRTYIGAGTSSFDGVFASLTSKPTTLAGYGLSLVKADVGLGSVDNTSDTAKPVSTAQTAAITAAVTIADQTLHGNISGVSAAAVGLTSSQVRTLLGLVIGTNVQAFNTGLAAIAGLTSAADKLPYFTGAGTAALADFTATARTLVAGANAAAMRTTIGAGTSSFDGVFTSLTSRPTTRGGYGITDAAANGLATGSGLTMATARILGRTTATTGAIEELTAGSSLSLAAGVLDAIQDIRTSATPTFVGINGTTLLLKTGGTTAINIDGSQNVGIGIAPTAARLNVLGSINFGPSDSACVAVGTTTTFTPSGGNPTAHYGMTFGGFTTNSISISGYNGIAFYTTGGIERMKIDTSGNVNISGPIKTANPSGGTAQLVKFGSYVAGAPTATGYQQVEINGTAYKLLTAT